MTKKIWWWAAGIAVGLALIVWAVSLGRPVSAPVGKQPPVEVLTAIKIGYRDHSGYWPAFVAQEEGLFAKNGLKAELINFKSTNQLMESLMKGDIDAALGAVNTILLATIQSKSPGEFKIFTIADETEAKPFSVLAVKNDSPIDSLSALAGKKISAHPGSTPKYLFKKAITDRLGGEQAILAQMENNLQLQALASGQTDAAILFEPDVATGLSKRIIKILDKSLWAEFAPDKIFPLQASVMSKKMVENNPEMARKLVKATDEAIDFARWREDKTKLAIAKYTSLDPAISGLVPIFDTHKLSEINEPRLQAMFDMLFKDGEIKTPVRAKDMLLPLYDSNQ